MHIASITLDPTRAPSPTHRAEMARLVRASVQATPDAEVRPLWMRPSRDLLIISSDAIPDWDLIPGAESANMSRVPLHPSGTWVHWTLMAQPTAAATAPGHGQRGKRRLLPESQFRSWLERRLAGALDVTEMRWRRIAPQVRTGRPAPVAYLMEGHGLVLDGQALYDLCLDGVGAGKSAGHGLLLTWHDE